MKYLRAAVALLASTASMATATETRLWVVDTASEFLKGRGEGVAVTREGRLSRSAGWREGVTFSEPLVVAGGLLSDGSLIVGTGHPARLYRADEDSKELLTSIPGEQVTAVLVVDDDEVLVASMPPGVLYRWSEHRLEEVARLGEGGIWDLAVFRDEVVAAAGTPASLYRLGPRGLERWLELPDGHARSLAPTSDALLVGTSGKGLILAVQPSGRVALLADSPFTEISALVAAPDGSVWATALVGEPAKAPPSKKKGEASDPKKGATTESAALNLELPKVNGATATSELLRLTPEGALLSVHRFAKQVASALAWDGDAVVVGTGYEGEVWRFVDEGGSRLSAVDAVQVVAAVDGGAVLLTQGPGQVLWRRKARDDSSRFRIDAKRFERPVRLGEYRVAPAREDVQIRFRSGASAKPDDTWLPWTEWLTPANGAVPLPPARSLQWEVELERDATVERVEVAFREVNLAPRLQSVSVEEPGVVYLAAPPPSGPVIERSHPDFSGIFSVIDEKRKNNQAKKAQGKKFWRVGFRTVSWKAEDPNQDPLRFELEMERQDGFRLPVRTNVDGTQLAIDTTAVPDGTYRFHVAASDQLGNPGDALSTEEGSRWFVVDNTPPRVNLQQRDGSWQVTVEDARSAVARVEWSRDGERWNALAAADGVLDGTNERFSFPSEEGRHLVVVRAIDRHHNRATAAVVEE
jgi:hypothetical protein